MRALLQGFGCSREEMNPALARRLLTLMLLHRASDPIRHIAIPSWLEKIEKLRDLERLLWPF